MADKDETDASEKTTTTTSIAAADTAAAALPSVTEREKEIAQSSLHEFEKGNYKACVELLNQLLASRALDPKVLHNRSVTEFYLSQFTKVDEFKKSLANVCTQVNLEDCEGLDDVDQCVIFYNQAVIFFHLRQYHAAIAILDKVFQFIEPLEESLARKVCFLLLELYLCTFQTDKGMGLLGFTETLLFGSQSETGKSHSPEKEKDKSSKDGGGGKDPDSAASNEVYRAKLQQYKARLYVMLKSMKACKREVKGLIGSVGLNTFTVYLKSNLEYLRGNYRKALKVINTAPHPAQSSKGGDDYPVMYYNNVGCIHFYLGKPHLGSFYFRQALRENEKAAHAVIQYSGDSSNSKVALSVLGKSKHYELLFNLGLQLLHARCPLPAFECLMEIVQVYPTNPRLWLRLAECCIMVHKPDNAVDFQRSQSRQQDVVQGVIGTGPNRKVILARGLSNKMFSTPENQSAAMPMPTLEFSALCLKNALLLVNDEGLGTTPSQLGSDDGGDSGSVATDSGGHSVPCLPSNPIRGNEVTNLRTSILVASAYVSLCLGDNVMVLHFTETLLAQPKLCGVHKLLGHLYSGEALILLDRISDAVEHLNPDHIKDVPMTLLDREDKGNNQQSETQQSATTTTPQLHGWFPNHASARVVMQYNLSVAFALRGEYEKASDLMCQLGAARSAGGVDVPVQVVMLAMYIQLQQGNADGARNIVSQYLPQFR